MRQHRATVLGIVLSVCVSLAGCVGDSTKSASDSPVSSPIASVQGEPAPPADPSSSSELTEGAAGNETYGADTVPPMAEGMPALPPEAGDVQKRAVDQDYWRITNGGIGEFAGWATGTYVEVITGDFNRDQRTDVALINRSTGWTTMPVAFANGDGSWRITNRSSGIFAGLARTIVPPGGDIQGGGSVNVLTGDFNADSQTDVALLNRKDGWTTMPVAFARGDGSWSITNRDIGDFARWATYDSVVVLTGHFNNDSRTDVVLINRSPGWTTMPVAFATGDGGWRITNSSSGDFAVWAASHESAYVMPFTGDFNHDGLTDIALIRRTPGSSLTGAGWTTMPVAFANGDGSWRITNGGIGEFAGWAATIPFGSVEVLTGDFNNDRNTDVALLRRTAGWTTMPVAFANGDGSWRITNRDIGEFAGWAALSPCCSVKYLTGGFNNNDERTDVALLRSTAGWTTMPVAFANGDGSWRITNGGIGEFAGWATQNVRVLTGDFNKDRRTDVALLKRSPGWTTMPVAFANSH